MATYKEVNMGDLREELEKSFTEAEEVLEPAEPVEEIEEPTEPKDEPVDPVEGKDEPTGEPTETTAEHTEELEETGIDAPLAWPAQYKEQFKSLPKDVQEYISQREADIHKNMTSQDGDLRYGREMKEVISPYMPLIQSLGSTPTKAIQETLNVAYVLNQGTPQQKAQAIAQMVQQHGIDLRLAQGQDPMKAMQSQMANFDPEKIKADIKAEFEEQEINKQVQAFASDPANVHFEKVKPMMASLLESGQANDMKEAYDMACHAHPEVRSTLQEQASKEKEAKRKQELEAKKKASASVTGSPDGTVNSSPAKNLSLRDELAQQWDEQSSAAI